jgi:3,4-dihydroxy 2-butanone 4-phosphate synthase/GTP cyclohydrolase II
MKMIEEALMPTEYGNFLMKTYARDPKTYSPDIAMVSEHFDPRFSIPLVRLHSECLTGDLFHSKRCDCGSQLKEALIRINKEGGVLIYLRQEGRGIGLINKLKAYQLQDGGKDTYEANVHLGFEEDAREYSTAAYILKDLGIQKFRLLTNNPQKILAFEHSTLEVVERIPLIIRPNSFNELYLSAKKQKKGHLLD